ncbi:hypothetical protein [Botrimarina colliarenosi]|uniref:hypothetical protein n=1 Tax=Botrimarina colliarenosi TaxID=2528001 RepID=UPI0018D2CB21|nr:hypothetical protein [Botrimarina colliarenosi]
MTPGRAVLMAGLGVALGWVWGPQLAAHFATPGDSDTVALRVPSGATTPPPNPRVGAPGGSAAPLAASNERETPRFSVEEAAGYDPFALPDWSPVAAQQMPDGSVAPTTADTTGSRFENLRRQGVAMILVSGGGHAAQVGDRTLHVGDVIDGFEVVGIGPTGVDFRPAPAPSTEGSRGA